METSSSGIGKRIFVYGLKVCQVVATDDVAVVLV